MRDEVKKFLYDVHSSCNNINDFIKGKRFEDFNSNLLLISAVERQFEIIGEALSQAEKIYPDLKNGITDLRKIINFRNILIHGYAVISHDILWGIIENDLQKLISDVSALLDS